MRRVLVSVEGQTEEIFVRDTLAPHLLDHGVAIQHVILKTKRLAGGSAHRGGVSKWSKIEQEIRLLLRDSDAAAITTMYDLYGLPADTPGAGHARGDVDPHHRAAHIETEIQNRFDDSRLDAYLQIHEFEAMLFGVPDHVAARAGQPKLARLMTDAANVAGGPELVDDGPQTTPSKRLVTIWPEFTKTLDGPAIVKAAGLATIRASCPHLDNWIGRLERLGRL